MEKKDSFQIFDNSSVVQDDALPLYHQILSFIRQQIKSGVLKPGDEIPSEAQLCSLYNVSRTTVRQALNQLSEENLILRRRGKGTVVASQKLHRNLNHLYSFTDDMKALNLEPLSTILESSVQIASEDISKNLNIPNKSSVYKLARIRSANNEPLLIETTYIPLYLCPDIDKQDFTKVSLYDFLRKEYGLVLFRATETYEAVKLNKIEAGYLRCAKSDPAFRIKRVAYLDSGFAFEYTSSITRSDKCVFKVELKTRKNQVSFSRQINI